MKMWIGNLDGERQGVVVAKTKKRALEILRVGRTDFANHWHEEPVDMAFEPETLYTRPISPTVGGRLWQLGRCPIVRAR